VARRALTVHPAWGVGALPERFPERHGDRSSWFASRARSNSSHSGSSRVRSSRRGGRRSSSCSASRSSSGAGVDDPQPERGEFDDLHPVYAPGYDVLSDTTLREQLESRGVRRLVLRGGRTNHHVASTARSALTRGYEVVVAADTMLAGSTRTRDSVCPLPQDSHALTLATLDRLGATVTSVHGVVTGSYEPLISEYPTALYTDAVGEADFVETPPRSTPSLHPTATALVVVNVREECPAPEFGYRSNNQAELQVERLVDAWRTRDRPILHTIHPPHFLPDDPVLRGSTVRPMSDESIIEAATADAFVRTELDDVLPVAWYRTTRARRTAALGGGRRHCANRARAQLRCAYDRGRDRWIRLPR
jgi:nicotinamidase-related amidase